MADRKVSLVTGGARGIGRSIALALAKQGADVAVADIRDAAETVDQIRALGRRAMAVKFDVADYQQVVAGVGQVARELGPVGILVNNAAITTNVATIQKMEPEAWAREIAINLSGVFHCTKAVLNGMVAAKWGRIVCISSAAGIMGGFGQCAYSSAKAGILGFVRTVALEHARDGIAANAVIPGLVNTDAAAAIPEELRERIVRTIPSQKMGEAEDIANAVAFLCSDGAGYINGTELKVTGGCELFTF